MADKNNIVVLGAGVSGLTTALLLSRDKSNSITIVAKHMPGDYDIEYASPWAGANYHPVGQEGTSLGRWERNTWADLEHLAANVKAAGIHFQDTVMHFRDKDAGTARGNASNKEWREYPWYRDVVPNFAVVPKDKLPDGVDFSTSFTSVCINTAIYLPWLVSQCLANDVVFRRGICRHVADAAALHHVSKANVVVNATGLSSLTLGGVQDTTMYPARGQIVVVRNDPGQMTFSSGTEDGPEEETYIMQRAAGGGTVLGGSYQPNNWDPLPDPSLANRIMQRCVSLCPALTQDSVAKSLRNAGRGDSTEQTPDPRGTTKRDTTAPVTALSVVRHGVGLRPTRKDGPRVEKEKIAGVWVVHNYGHGGYGYQSSYGCAYDAIELVKSCIGSKSKL